MGEPLEHYARGEVLLGELSFRELPLDEIVLVFDAMENREVARSVIVY